MTADDAPLVKHRNTHQRDVVRGVVASGNFRTAQEIFEILRAGGEHIGLATVYRSLQRMADAGEIDAIRSPDGQMAYRRCSAGHHHHLTCRVCGRTVEIAAPELEALLSSLGDTYGFSQIDHEIELRGCCTQCRDKADS